MDMRILARKFKLVLLFGPKLDTCNHVCFDYKSVDSILVKSGVHRVILSLKMV